MKIKLLLFLSLLLLSVPMLLAQTSGGPDAYGYIWRNNLDPLGQPYNWKDIKSIGTKINGLGDDNVAGPFHLNFNFNYYGINYDSIYVGANGFISFQYGVNLSSPFDSIPKTGGSSNNFAAPQLSDLTFVNSSNIAIAGADAYYYTNNIDTFIVQWDSVPFWSNVTPFYSGRNTFQVILFSTEGSITFQYKLQSGTSPNAGNTVLTGIENNTGQIGLEVSRNVYPLANSSVRIANPTVFSTNDNSNAFISLAQNFPNPAKNFTTIPYVLAQNTSVEFIVEDVFGQEVESFLLGNQSAGRRTFLLTTEKYSSGVYFYSLKTNEIKTTRKMLLVK